jgi:replicative DNA helicase Mcm
MDAAEITSKFIEFIEEYYYERLIENIRKGLNYLVIDCRKLSKHDVELAELLIDDPETTLKAASIAVSSIENHKNDFFYIRLKNTPKSLTVPIRNIRKEHMGKLISIEGSIKNRTNVRPQITKARFECPSCGNIIDILQLDTEYREPTRCGCGRKGKFTNISNETLDVQYLSIEEPFDQLGDDTVPQRIAVMFKEDLTHPKNQADFIPGKPTQITGILKEVQLSTKNKKSVKLDYIIEANNYKSLEDNLTKTKFTDKEIKEFKELSKDKNLYQKLIKSVAPHIHGHEKVKEAMLLFLAKGVSKESNDGKRTREYFNLLLMGDPGVAKSQLGNEINLLSWRSRKVVGKGASGPGLTASAEKDEVLNMRVLSAGAIPLCNGGHVVIDEVDKMEKDVQSHLHESMEDGTITVNKSQIQGQLKARTAVFMIGNPKYGRYDIHAPIFGQIDLPKPLINRFDLMFPVRDTPTKESDIELADAVLNKHKDINKATERIIPLTLLKNYICYVALNIKPKLTDGAADELKTFFRKLRNIGKSESLGITARQLDGLVRMSEASAKLHMRSEVAVDDAKIAIALMTYSLKCFGTDPDTGKLDIDMISTGITSTQRNKLTKLEKIIIELDEDKKKIVPIEDLISVATDQGMDREKIEKTIENLRRAGVIFEPRKGFIRRL